MNTEIFNIIENQIKNNNIVLYMKGTKEMPSCGFSSAVVNILNKFNLDYITVNVLDDAEIREAIKQYTNWPTLPQLYVMGEFIGGCDIVREMHKSGEFEELLKSKNLI